MVDHPALILVVLVSLAWKVTDLLASLGPTIWTVCTSIIPSQASSNVSRLRQQQAEVLRIRREMTATSSQDEFAKWAKLRREHDKRVNDLEKLCIPPLPFLLELCPSVRPTMDKTLIADWLNGCKAARVASQRLAVTGWISALRWALLTAVGLVIQFWYRKHPVFWLPDGLVHPYIEFALAFPQAPRGSISINVWSTCATITVGIIFKLLTPSTMVSQHPSTRVPGTSQMSR